MCIGVSEYCFSVLCVCVCVVTASDSDLKKIGNTFLQLKLVLDKGAGTEDVFMGAFIYIVIKRHLKRTIRFKFQLHI